MKELKFVTKEDFAPFEEVIEFPGDCNEPFYIIEKEEEAPWRLAVFRFSNNRITAMEKHVSSKESFEPLSGIAVLILALEHSPQDYKAFILNKPVCLKKGTWHQVLSLTPEAQVKITENLEVTSEFYELEHPVGVGMCEI